MTTHIQVVIDERLVQRCAFLDDLEAFGDGIVVALGQAVAHDVNHGGQDGLEVVDLVAVVHIVEEGRRGEHRLLLNDA